MQMGIHVISLCSLCLTLEHSLQGSYVGEKGWLWEDLGAL